MGQKKTDGNITHKLKDDSKSASRKQVNSGLKRIRRKLGERSKKNLKELKAQIAYKIKGIN